MITLKSPERVLISVSGEISVQYINNKIIIELLMKYDDCDFYLKITSDLYIKITLIIMQIIPQKVVYKNINHSKQKKFIFLINSC